MPDQSPSIDPSIQENREAILRLAEDYGAFNVRVFGSAARGHLQEGSDVDLLIDMKPKRSLFDLGRLKQDLEGLLGRKVDVVTEDSLYWLLLRRILKEARPL